MSAITIYPFSEINYQEVKEFVVGCLSEEDLALKEGSEVTGKAICPITMREINLVSGFCQETRRSCEFHG